MKKLIPLLTIAILALAPCAANSASGPMSTSMVGVGPHGYDFLIGTWSCTNSTPSPIGGPAATTLTFARSANGSISIHAAGSDFDSLGYVVYDSKTKTWWTPGGLGDRGLQHRIHAADRQENGLERNVLQCRDGQDRPDSGYLHPGHHDHLQGSIASGDRGHLENRRHHHLHQVVNVVLVRRQDPRAKQVRRSPVLAA